MFCVALSVYFRKELGDRLVYFLKILLKFTVLLKPHSVAICKILISVVLIKVNAFSTRFIQI